MLPLGDCPLVYSGSIIRAGDQVSLLSVEVRMIRIQREAAAAEVAAADAVTKIGQQYRSLILSTKSA